MACVSSWPSASAYCSCNQEYTPMLIIIDKSWEALTCAPCMVNTCISEIKAAQAGIHDRGGIFSSKAYGRNDAMGWNPTDHQGWRQKWLSEKIRCYNVIRRLEQVKIDQSHEFEACGVDEALKLWEEAKDECCQIPGYRYVDDNSKKNTTQGTLKDQEPGENNQPNQSESPELPDYPAWLHSNAVNTEPSRLTSPPPLSHDISKRYDMGDVIICENKSVYSLRNRELKGASGKLPDGETEHIRKTDPPALLIQSELEKTRRGSAYPPTVTAAVSCAPEASGPNKTTKPPTLRPAWKSTTSRSLATKCKIKFDPLATILPHYGDPSPTTVKKKHSAHTNVHQSHSRLLLNRMCTPHLYRTWSSPMGYKKVNTSHIRTSWLDYERLQRDLDQEEQEAKQKSKTPDVQDLVIDADAPAQVEGRQRKREDFAPRVAVPYGLGNLNMRRGSRPKTTPAPWKKKVSWREEESER